MSFSSTYLSRKALIADNLQSMGVLSADADDGLTTLANKILDIEPSISGLDLDTSLTIHSSDTSCLIGQSIMFWAELKADYDDETATDVDLSGVLTGATVEFKNGNTILGSAVTDSDGIAYYTHTFSIGDEYNISASFAGTNNFDDCVSNSITVSVPYEILITADKPILAYNDNEYATITATLSDGGSGISGEMLIYDILDKNDNVLDSDADITDSNGEISFTYQSSGIGDVQVIVWYNNDINTMSLQETYELEDYIYYNTLTSNTNGFTLNGDLSRTFSQNGVTIKAMISENTLSFDSSIPSNCRIECDVQEMIIGMGDLSAELYVQNTSIANVRNNAVIGTRLYTKSPSSYTDYTGHTPPFHLGIEVNGDTMTYYIDGTLLGSRSGDTSGTFGLRASMVRGITIKNLKIKAL